MHWKLSALWLFVALVFPAFAAHPANAPAARIKVAVDGSFELSVRFDILAFALGETPADATDAEMNGLLDGPLTSLEDRLLEAKNRLTSKLAVRGEGGAAKVESLNFPTAAQVHLLVVALGPKRLPVMATIVEKGKLPGGSKEITLSFPESLGPLVLTTEFPYLEPISEPLDAGALSTPRALPSSEEVDAAARKVNDRANAERLAAANPNVPEAQIQRDIQSQYDAWSKAYMKNDVEVLLGILAADYSLTTSDNRVIRRPEYEATLNLRKRANADTSSYSTRILRITLEKSGVSVISRETSISHRKNEKTGLLEEVSHEHDYLDRWIFLTGKWLLSSTVTQRELTQIK